MKEIKCVKCGYEWNSKSRLAFVSCPSCLSKVNTKPVTNTTTTQSIVREPVKGSE